MIKNKCKHEWRQFMEASGSIPAKYECSQCKVWLSASDVYQLETLEYLQGFQKFLSVVAILISLVALLFSFLK